MPQPDLLRLCVRRRAFPHELAVRAHECVEQIERPSAWCCSRFQRTEPPRFSRRTRFGPTEQRHGCQALTGHRGGGLGPLHNHVDEVLRPIQMHVMTAAVDHLDARVSHRGINGAALFVDRGNSIVGSEEDQCRNGHRAG